MTLPQQGGEAVPEPGNSLMSPHCRHGNYSPGLGAWPWPGQEAEEGVGNWRLFSS